MLRPLAFVLAAAAAAMPPAALPAQTAKDGQAAKDPGTRERAFLQKTATALNGIADAFTEQKQHARALEIRRELLLEYLADDPTAREKCGFVREGDHWRRDET